MIFRLQTCFGILFDYKTTWRNVEQAPTSPVHVRRSTSTALCPETLPLDWDFCTWQGAL